MPTEYILDPQTADQIVRMEAVQRVLVPIAAIILGIAAIVFLVFLFLNENDRRNQTIDQQQQMIEKLKGRIAQLREENARYFEERVKDAKAFCEAEADWEWKYSEMERETAERISMIEQDATERIEAAERGRMEANGRKKQAEKARYTFAECADRFRRKIA